MRIDVQCHYFPKVVERYMCDNSFPKCIRVEGGLMCDFGSQKLMLPDMQYDPAAIMRAMDQGQVDLALISSNIPDPGFLTAEKEASLCSELNEVTAETVRDSKGRFAGMGFLPWRSPQKAVEEIRRVKELDLKGVMLFTRLGQLQVDDPSLEEIYKTCAENALPLFIHPTVPMWHESIGAYGMVANTSFVIDTAFAFMRLCYSGILDRYPQLNVVIPHAGGIMPILDGRLGYVPPAVRRFIDPDKRTVLDTLFSEQVWFDLANPSLKVLSYFKSYLGMDRAMYGTDYPFVEPFYQTELLESLELTEEEKEQINWKNAKKLFCLDL